MPSWEEFTARKQTEREPTAALTSGGRTEVTAAHTRLLRMALAVEESTAYWERYDPKIPLSKRAKVAFEEHWFGTKSLDRVRYLIASFALRYDAFPNALTVLSQWSSMDYATRHVICHWHLQLSDPIYRRFTGELLLRRRTLREAKVDKDAVFHWLKSEIKDKWSETVCLQFTGKLLSTAREAGLVSRHDPRTLSFPNVTDHALAYLLYLLRELKFDGSLTRNLYLQSVGLDEDLLGQRAQHLPSVTRQKMMGVVDFEWTHADLASWAKGLVA